MSHDAKLRRYSLLAACLIAFSAGVSAARAEAANDTCPPDGSSIALLTRQAFDEGRVLEGREYGRLVGELSGIARSGDKEEEIIEKSIAVVTSFATQIRAKGHDFTVGEIIIHRESELSSLVQLNLKPIRKATLALQLAVIREAKRAICLR